MNAASRVKCEAPLDELSLDDLLAKAKAKFTVAFEPLTVAGDTLEFLQITDMQDYIECLDRERGTDAGLSLPLWARIWPSAILLSYFIQRFDPADGQKLLELGAGVGVCGLFAAKRGFDATISDVNPDALLFAQINILKNGLADKARVRRIDFTKDRPAERFDRILGSEILYIWKTPIGDW